MPASRLHPFLRLFLCALAVLVVTSIVGAVGAGVLIALNPTLGLSNPTIAQLTQKLTHDYGLWLTVLAYPPALFVIWLFRTQLDNRSWSSLGFRRTGAFSNFGLGALTGILTLSVLFALMWLSGAIQFGGLSQDVLTHGWLYAIASLCGYALAFLLVGFMEETAFRGYGLHNLKQWIGWTRAVWVQAVVFALIHMGNVNGSSDPNALKSAIGALPSLALIAVFFALAYRKTGSLWFPVGFHFAWNFCLGCVFSQPVSAIGTFRLFDVNETGQNFLSGGDFGAEGSFFLIPLIVGLIYLLWRSPDHPQAVADLGNQESAPVLAPTFEPSYPMNASVPVVVNQSLEEEEPRPNRFNARFGSGEGFDSGMLRELKQMQDAREDAERQRVEAERAERKAEEMREEALRRAQITVQTMAAREIETKEAEVVVTEGLAFKVGLEKPDVATPTAEEEARLQEVPISPQPRIERIKETTPTTSAPVAPPAPSAPSLPASPVAQSSPVVPPEPVNTTPPTSPNEAPPKKVRPRW